MRGLRYQPQGRPVLGASALSRMLVASASGSQHYAAALNRPIKLASGVSRVATIHGLAFQHSSSGGNVDFGATGGISSLVAPGAPFSVFLRVFVTDLVNRQGLFTDHDAAGSNESLALEITSAGQWRVTTFGGMNEILVGGATLGWHDVMVVHLPGTGNRLYVDGVLVGAAGFTGPLSAGSAARVGSFGAYSDLCFRGRTSVFHMFQGDVSLYRDALSRNPWSVFADPDDDGLQPQASAAVTQLSVSPAAMLLSGGTVGMRAARRIALSPAASVVTSGIVAVRAARRVAIAPATMAVVGGTLQLQFTPAPGSGSYSMAVSPAALALSPGGVGLRVQRRQSVNAASYSLSWRTVVLNASVAAPPVDAQQIPASRTVVFPGGKRVVTFGGGTRVVNFDVPFTGSSKGNSMTNAPEPYFKDGKWWVDKDPDEESFYVANITKELTDRGTTAVSVVPIVKGVEVLVAPQIQGNFVVIKLGGMDVTANAENYWIARVTCANSERFDRTMWFNKVDN